MVAESCCVRLSLRCQLLLHFFQLVQVTAEALGFTIIFAIEVVQNHCLTAAEFFDFLGQRGNLLGKLTALGNLQQGCGVASGLQLLLLGFLVSKLLCYRMIILQNGAVIVDPDVSMYRPVCCSQQAVLQHYQTCCAAVPTFPAICSTVFSTALDSFGNGLSVPAAACCPRGFGGSVRSGLP